MRAIQTQQFRTGFQDLDQPVRVMKFGVDLGIYLPLNEGKPVRKTTPPRLLEAEPATSRKSSRVERVATPRVIARTTGKIDGRTKAARAAKAARLEAQAAASSVTVTPPPVRRPRGRPRRKPVAAPSQEAQGMVPVHNPGF